MLIIFLQNFPGRGQGGGGGNQTASRIKTKIIAQLKEEHVEIIWLLMTLIHLTITQPKTACWVYEKEKAKSKSKQSSRYFTSSPLPGGCERQNKVIAVEEGTT